MARPSRACMGVCKEQIRPQLCTQTLETSRTRQVLQRRYECPAPKSGQTTRVGSVSGWAENRPSRTMQRLAAATPRQLAIPPSPGFIEAQRRPARQLDKFATESVG